MQIGTYGMGPPLRTENDGVLYIACPMYVATGGPELAHQLCFHLRALGINACMALFGNRKSDADPDPGPVPTDYEVYQNPYVLTINPGPNDVLIVPETMTEHLSAYPNLRQAIWWMSVDNYSASIQGNRRNIVKSFLRRLKWRLHRNRRPFLLQWDRAAPIAHLYQSDYARQFLLAHKISPQALFPLGDHLNPSFLAQPPNVAAHTARKEDVVLYNPKKGIKFTRTLIAAAPELTFEPLQGLTRDQMVQRLQSCKVYIDFGTHPGKDRIPREACISGCCILTNRRGSAANAVDVAIPPEYKFDDTATDTSVIVAKLKDIMADFETHTARFNPYRAAIRAEPALFIQQIRALTGLV